MGNAATASVQPDLDVRLQKSQAALQELHLKQQADQTRFDQKQAEVDELKAEYERVKRSRELTQLKTQQFDQEMAKRLNDALAASTSAYETSMQISAHQVSTKDSASIAEAHHLARSQRDQRMHATALEARLLEQQLLQARRATMVAQEVTMQMQDQTGLALERKHKHHATKVEELKWAMHKMVPERADIDQISTASTTPHTQMEHMIRPNIMKSQKTVF